MALRTLSVALANIVEVGQSVDGATVIIESRRNDHTTSASIVSGSTSRICDSNGDCIFSLIPNADGYAGNKYHASAHRNGKQIMSGQFAMPDVDSNLEDLL